MSETKHKRHATKLEQAILDAIDIHEQATTFRLSEVARLVSPIDWARLGNTLYRIAREAGLRE